MEKIFNFLERKKILTLLLILAITTIAYSNIIANGFVWDDPDFYKNWTALYRWDSVGQLLQGQVPIQHEGVYRPLRGVIQLFLFQAIGPSNIPAYHVVSLLIHLAAVVAVYLLIEKLFGSRIMAGFTALLFGLHPIHTEAITYLTTSIDAIGVVFLLWSIYGYLKNQKKWLIVSVMLSWLAFFTYEMTLILPLLLLLIEWQKADYHYQPAFKKIKSLWPYFVGLGLWLIVRLSIQVGERSLTPDPSQSSLPIRLITIGKAIVKYLYLLIWPNPLNVFHKIDLSRSLAEPKVFAAWLLVVLLAVASLVFAKKLKVVSFSLLWFFICFLPVANVIPTGIIMAEKYMYLASLSISIAIAYCLWQLTQKNNRLWTTVAIIVLVVISALYGIRTYARNFDWSSNATLWAATLRVRPDYGRVYSNLGFSLYQEKKYNEALDLFKKAVKLEPDLPLIYHDLGNVYDELGQYDLAIENFQKALAIREGHQGYNFAETYNNLAIVYQKINDFDQAAANYQKAVEFDPNYFRAYSNLGVLSLLDKDYTGAENYFNQALSLNENFAPAQHGLAVSLVNLGQIDAAIPHYLKSIQLDPNLTDNYNHLASIYEKQGQSQKAIEILRQGVAANPDNLELVTNLAIVLANDGQLAEAQQLLQQALQLNPNYEAAQQTLEKIQQTGNQ